MILTNTSWYMYHKHNNGMGAWSPKMQPLLSTTLLGPEYRKAYGTQPSIGPCDWGTRINCLTWWPIVTFGDKPLIQEKIHSKFQFKPALRWLKTLKCTLPEVKEKKLSCNLEHHEQVVLFIFYILFMIYKLHLTSALNKRQTSRNNCNQHFKFTWIKKKKKSWIHSS